MNSKFIFLFLVLTLSVFANEEEKKCATDFFLSFIQQVQKDYSLDCNSYSLPNDTEKFSVYFKSYQRASIEEARSMIIMLTERFLKSINSNEKIRPYLKEYPFPARCAQINVEFYNLANTSRCDGNIVLVSHLGQVKQNGWLTYRAAEVFSNLPYVVHEETYDEAEKIVKMTNASYKHQDTEFEKAIDIVLAAFTGHMYKKYRCSCEKIAALNSDSLEKIEAVFTVFQRADQNKARKIQIYAAETLMNLINESEVLRPYLKQHPFTAENLKIRLDFREYSAWSIGWLPYSHGSIDNVMLENNQLTYVSIEHENSESYESALKNAGNPTKASKFPFWKKLLGKANAKFFTFCAVRPLPLGGGYKAQMPFMTRRVI